MFRIIIEVDSIDKENVEIKSKSAKMNINDNEIKGLLKLLSSTGIKCIFGKAIEEEGITQKSIEDYLNNNIEIKEI